MSKSRKPRGFSLIVITFALVLSTVQNIPAANATTLTCAQGGECVVGDTGPGGGKVFYVDSTGNGFNCGPTLAEKCIYLEYSRSLAVGGLPWSIASLNHTAIGATARGTLTGTGYKNTLAIIAQQGSYDAVANKYEAGAAQSFRGGGKTDWYQPSKDELTELYGSLAPDERNLGFANASTEIDDAHTWGIWASDAGSVITSGISKSDPNITIPIRAFTLAIDGNYACPDGSFDVFRGAVTHQSGCTGELTIPEGVGSINSGVFRDSLITKINFPSTLTSIGNNSFQSSHLREINIPNNVTSIGQFAFFSAEDVMTLSIGTGISDIPRYAFSGLMHIINLTIPSNISFINEMAFSNATALQSLTLSNGVQYIGYNAFSNAASLENLVIPSSVTELHNSSFSSLSSLKTLRILSTGIDYLGDEDSIFGGAGSLTCFTNLSNLRTVVSLDLPLGLPLGLPTCSTTSAPDAPVISTLTGGDRQLRIAFTIASDGGETVDLIQYSIDSGATWVSASGTTSPIDISSLSVGTSYTLQIRAHNSVGNSSGSNLKTASTTGSTSADRDAAAAAAAAREAARKAAIEKARINLLQEIKDNKPLFINSYLSADFEIPSTRALERINLAVQAMQAKTPDKQLSLDVVKAEVLKETVIDRLAKPETKKSVISAELIEVGLLENNYSNKTSVMLAIRNSPSSELDNFEKVQKVIAAQKAVVQARKARYAEIVSRINARAAKITK
ncbi:unannotated protein [freshwater metagenome]|uniref:Unannotated protein n=1 Tax=freshwater metagenome TaxID=449393 RepID=A0A6J7JF72_9ZZZZ|nr:leucine-rich repeat protein [Actinomycetota bacterium]